MKGTWSSWKKPYTLEQLGILNSYLQKYLAQAEKNKIPFQFPPRPTTRAGRRKWFKHLDPVVREKAISIYHDLQIKHKAKGTPVYILVATATRMAKQFYGLIPINPWGRQAAGRSNIIKSLRTMLGLNQSTPTLTDKCEVGQANLDGI